MSRLKATCGVIGEGERAFPEVLARLEAGRPLEGIDGVITAPKSDVPITALTARAVERLSELSPPAHDLCNYAAYVRGGGFVSVQTKRGCPFQCIYCIYPQLEGRRYRLRSPEAVVRELKTWPSGRRCAISFLWTVSLTTRANMLWPSAASSVAADCRSAGRPFATRQVLMRNWRAR